MVKQAQLPDGTTLEFPDETPDGVMDNAVQQHVNYTKSYSTVGGTISRQAGLLGRDVVQGATSLPTAIANIPAFVANNAIVKPYNYFTKGSAKEVPYVDPFGQGMSALGAPEPQSTNENREQAVIQPLAGVATGGAAAGGGNGFINSALGKNLPLQYQAAAGSSLSGEAAKEGNLSPPAQTALSIAGGFAVPGAVNIAAGLRGALSPFTASGKQQIAANTLATFADDPAKAAVSLQNPTQHIPNSPMTAGTASGDYGLMNLEKTFANEKPFVDTVVGQNKARLDALQKVAGTESDIDTAMNVRDAATKPLYEMAKGQPVNGAAIKPVLSQIDNAVAEVGEGSEAGKQLLAYKAKIQGALPESVVKKTGLVDSSGNPITTTSSAPVPQSQIAQIYRETRDTLQAKAMQNNALTPAVKAYMQPINHALGEAIESQSPIFAQAQQKFRSLSEPINQMQNAQSVVKGIQGPIQDAEGNFYLSPAKAGNLIKQGEVNTDYKGWQKLEDALSPAQYAALTGVQKDIARSNLLNSPAIKTVGSNTYSNLAGGNALNNATGGLLNGSLPVPFVSKAYAGPNEAIKDILREAMQDPAKARQLLMMGKPNAQGQFLPALMKGLATAGFAGSAYGN